MRLTVVQALVLLSLAATIATWASTEGEKSAPVARGAPATTIPESVKQRLPARAGVSGVASSGMEDENARMTDVRVLVDRSRCGGAGDAPFLLMTEAFGWTVDDIPGDPDWKVDGKIVRPREITRSLLNGYDLVIRVNEWAPRGMPAYTPSEIEAYRGWVKDGGRLIPLSNQHPVPDQLSEAFGVIAYGVDSPLGVVVDRWADHPMTRGLGVSKAQGMGAIIRWPSRAKVLGWASKDSRFRYYDRYQGREVYLEGPPVLAALPYGKGVVVFLTWSGAFSRQWFPDPFSSNMVLWTALGQVPGHIAGRVMGCDGRPVPNVTIDIMPSHQAHKLRTRMTTPAEPYWRDYLRKAHEDPYGGRFHSGPLVSGSYDVRAYQPGCGCATVCKVQVSDGQAAEVELKIPWSSDRNVYPAYLYPVSGAAGYTAVSDSRVNRLVERYAPVLWLHPAERLVPMRAEFMLDHAVLENGELGRTAVASDPMPGKESFLDMRGGSSSDLTVEGYRKLLASCPQKRFYDNVVYVRVLEDSSGPDGRNHLVVQYWFHYIYNDFVNFHEGDWEMIELIWDESSVARAADADSSPFQAAYAQHDSGSRRPWSKVERVGTHPVVYVQLGSHGSYFDDSLLDIMVGGGRKLVPPGLSDGTQYELVPLNDQIPKTGNWLNYPGHWGERAELIAPLGEVKSFSGPRGPKFQDQSDKWWRPAEWGLGLE